MTDPKTVLLVEDNEDNRIIYATALRYAGYKVIEAITGTEGVHHARVDKPDLILMDISVPELDGWEATRSSKRTRPRSTFRSSPSRRTRCRATRSAACRGCDGYLAKPITPAALIGEVDRRFGRTKPSYVPAAVQE
jgi:CheY-like chemotaxis protein